VKIGQVTVTDTIYWIPISRVSAENRLCFALDIKVWRIGWQLATATLPETTRSSNPSPTTPPCLCHQESKFHISHFVSTFIFPP